LASGARCNYRLHQPIGKNLMIDPRYAETLFNHLYSNIDGYAVSTAARQASSGIDTEKLLYGELPFQTCKEIIEYANPKKDGIFFDLGSGTGRVVMAFYLLTNFKKCIGIELLQGLHDKACEINTQFNQNIKLQLKGDIQDREMQLKCGDIFATNLQEADLVFINHPFKEGDIFKRLEEKLLDELKPKSKIITIIRCLDNPRFKKLGQKTYKFSWGDSTAHFFES
jgi:SAM-dependent methyltransferase